MSDPTDIQSEEIVSADIVPVANLCVPGDATMDPDTLGANPDITGAENRKPGARGGSKTSPSNAGNAGHQ
ncbi:MAG: hypothetical protein ABSH28_09060 [Acidobacteriota bacterium]|jgi:hypothetical protein